MIVDPANISQYLPSVNFKVDSRRFVPYLEEAQMEITDKILGEHLEFILENSYDESLSDLKILVSRAVCVTAYLNAIPEMDLQLSEAGFVVASNEAVKPASKERVEKLMQSLHRRKSAVLDNLLVFLIHNSTGDASPVKDWRGSRQFAYFSQTPIFSFAEFESYSTIVNPCSENNIDWNQFYSLIPTMTEKLNTVVAYYISKEYIINFMERMRDYEPILDIERQVINYVKRSLVAAALGDDKNMKDMAVIARKLMLSNIDYFPVFLDSDSYQLPTMNIAGSGGVSNFL